MRTLRLRVSAFSATNLRTFAEVRAGILVFRELAHSHSRNESLSTSRFEKGPFRKRGRRKSSPSPAGGDGGSEFAKERQGVVPTEAGVGDALAVDKLLCRSKRLGASDEIAFEHDAKNSLITFRDLRSDVARNDSLAAGVLAAIGV